VFGALAAQRLVIRENTRVHFDEAFLDSAPTSSALPRMMAWRVMPLPKAPLVSLRLDPRKVLQDAGLTPLVPSAAHELLDFRIDYVGTDGLRHLWEGNEAKFDWSAVSSTVKVVRIADLNFLSAL
jgi:hypothetical protein